jgi:hypothetical protein
MLAIMHHGKIDRRLAAMGGHHVPKPLRGFEHSSCGRKTPAHTGELSRCWDGGVTRQLDGLTNRGVIVLRLVDAR